MSKDAYYFSHDSNAKDDPKCMLLIDQLGLEGYGIFWVLVEILRDQPEYRYPIDLIPIIARRYNTSKEKMTAVVNNYNLFQIDEENNIFSLSLNTRMEHLQNVRNKRVIAGIASGKARKQKALNKCSTSVQDKLNKNEQSKVKESKVNESKIDIYSTHKLFYKSEYKKAVEYKKEYSTFINILFGKNEIDEVLAPVLKIQNQLTYKQFLKAYTLSKENGKSIPEIILSMHNKPKSINGNTSLYMTLRNWLKFKK